MPEGGLSQEIRSYPKVPVRIFNMSAKTIKIRPQSILCELQDVKLLRHIEDPLNTSTRAMVGSHTADVTENNDTTIPTCRGFPRQYRHRPGPEG